MAKKTANPSVSLVGNSFSFDNRNVPVDGNRRKAVNPLTRARPMNFNPIHLLGPAQSQDFTWIVA
jgi:hypothetical protein